MNGKQRKQSIRIKLVKIFVIVSVILFAVNMYIYYNFSKAIREIDHVYSSNIRLNELAGNLENMQKYLYQYLNTKSSESLEGYYIYEQDYRGKLNLFNTQATNDPVKLMEKNIYNMSASYLEKTGEAVEARRGRNVSRFKEYYVEAERIYQYLQSHINSMNTTVFLNNSNHYSVLRSYLNLVVGFSVGVLCVIMGAAIVWIIVMTRSITNPLIQLADAANEIAMGNIDVQFPIVNTNDEISTVAKACNKMIDSIREYIRETKENYRRERHLMENELIMKNDLKEAQLKYLQAQINPHFLFNSLNAGAQLAMMEGAERACIFIQKMADFFRYNVRKMDKNTSLQEELALVDNYIYILNVRFAGDIHYKTQIDERLVSVEMPSMILQPIIENAVNHGIREMEGEGEIRVSVYGDKEKIRISIADNGKGIEPEAAEKIMRGERAHDQTGKDSAGIGMDNVRNRLCRYYNTDQVMEIKGEPGKGTEVILCIPRKGEVQKHD